MSDDDLTLEDLDKLRPIFLGFRIFLSIVAIGLTITAGFKAWAWYIWIPLCGLAIFLIKFLGNIFQNTFVETEKEIREKSKQLYPVTDASSESGKVSIEEFLDMTPSPEDELKLAETYSKSSPKSLSKPNIILIAIFLMLMAGIFWYGFGMILALIIK